MDKILTDYTRRYKHALESSILALQHELEILNKGQLPERGETSQLSMLQDLVRKSGELNAILRSRH